MDGARFSIFSDDPFRSQSTVAILDLDEVPIRRPLQIHPPSRLVIPEYTSSRDVTPRSVEPHTPSTSPGSAIKSALSRMAATGKSKLRRFSFAKEIKSPIVIEPLSTSSPLNLQLPSFEEEEPLFDVDNFEIPKIPTPPSRPIPPVPTVTQLQRLPEVDLHNDFGADSIFSDDDESAFDADEESQFSEPSGWIANIRGELEKLATEVERMTASEARLNLDSPTDSEGTDLGEDEEYQGQEEEDS